MKKLLFFVLLAFPFFCFSQNDKSKTNIEIVEEKSDEIICGFNFPEYPGGRQELMKFLHKNLKYPQKAFLQKKEGKVFVAFIVNTNGKILNPKIVKSDSYLFNREAIRLVKMMPKWIPLEQNGSPIKGRVVIPINFRLKNNYYQ